MKRFLFIGVTIVLVSAGFFMGITFLNGKSSPKKDEAQLRRAAIQAIVSNRPSLVDGNTPVVEVVSLSTLEDGWYVATIKSIHEDIAKVPVKVVLADYGKSSPDLRVMIGPDTHFSEKEMLSLNFPDSVILELRKI